MYPNNLDAIYCEVINFQDIISNIKNMYFQPGPLPLSFRAFNATDTKTYKGPSDNNRSEQTSRKKARKKKDPKFKMNPHSVNGNSETLKS